MIFFGGDVGFLGFKHGQGDDSSQVLSMFCLGSFGGEDPLRQRIFVEKVLPGRWDWFQKSGKLTLLRLVLLKFLIIYIDFKYIAGILNHQQ